ncbi:MAG TPA: tetratricopeptide repeat protein, partial [Polyangia bacterium]|nr:tetratricopeptide repeat protein [Polyangia bacterium]
MGLFERLAGTLDELTGDRRTAVEAEVAQARAQAEAGDPTAAEDALDALTRRSPDAAPAFRALGELMARRGAFEAAVAPLGRAVDLDGGNALAWCALGETLAHLGRAEPARDALRRTLALAIEPALRARAHAALGQVMAATGRLTQAARELRKAIDLAGATGADDRLLARDYGRVLDQLGAPDASEWLTRAARADGAPPALFAEAADSLRDDSRAEPLLREGLERAPDDVALRAALIRFLLRTGRVHDALPAAEAACAAAPDDPRAWAALRLASARA